MKFAAFRSVRRTPGAEKKLRSVESSAAERWSGENVLFRPCFRLMDGLCFTLIELLIVIAITAIFVSMLLPALNKALQAAHAKSCQSNMKQQGVAILMYAEDNMGHYPVCDVSQPGYYAVPLNSYMGISGKTVEGSFNPRCGPKTKDRPYNGSIAFYCPAKNNKLPAARYLDYGAYHSQWNPTFIDLKIFHLKRSSVSILRLDSQYGIGAANGVGNITQTHQISYPHSDRSNSLYFDGHVATFSGKNLIKEKILEYMKIE